MSRAFAKWFPIIAAVDRFDAEAGGKEEQLQFTRKKDVHIEPGQIAFILSAREELLVRPDNMLQLLNLIKGKREMVPKKYQEEPAAGL